MAAEGTQISLDDLFPPDWENASPPDDWLNLPTDEPPPDWAVPDLNDIGSVIGPEVDPRATLETELAALDRRIEENAIEMNTPDGMRLLEDLELERDYLVGELEAFDEEPPIPVMAEQSAERTLVDARFLGQSHLDAEGNTTSYTVQAIALYTDVNETLSGSVLDVGHFGEQSAAVESYQALQESIDTGAITISEVGSLAEAMAEENGLDGHAWRVMDDHDLVNYEFHHSLSDDPERDIPAEALSTNPAFTAQLFSATLPDPDAAAQQQALLANEQALAALRGIGLEAPRDFDLSHDTFLDATTGGRIINGIFQADPGDATQHYAPLFVALTTGQDGLGFQAQAVEFGQSGTLSDVQQVQAQVQDALENGGISQAMETMQAIDALRLEPIAEIPEIKSWSRDID